jgi:homoserine kinase
MDISKCTVIVPGSSANIGSGFDTFGLAVSIYAYFSFRERKGKVIEYFGVGPKPEEDESNIVFVSFSRILKEFREKIPTDLSIWVKNHIPIKRGLGSSSSAIVGGLTLGYLYLLSRGKIKGELEDFKVAKEKVILPLAIEIEGHPDNVTPAIIGGFSVCSLDGYNKFDKIDFPEDIKLVFVMPEFEVSTKEARKVLPKMYPLDDVVKNMKYAVSLIIGVMKRRYDLIKIGLKDELHQKYRKHLYKGFEKILELDGGEFETPYIGSFISGSGPTFCLMFLGVPKFNDLARIRDFLSKETSIDYDIQILSVDNLGVRII